MIEGLLTFLRLQDRDLSLLLTDNKGIKRLNKRYFNRDKPTNVISFSYMEDAISPSVDNVIGDIVVSVEMAEYEARLAGCNTLERLVELIIHGLVHVLGYDHEKDEKDARRMRYRERRLLKFLGVQKAYRDFISEDRKVSGEAENH